MKKLFLFTWSSALIVPWLVFIPLDTQASPSLYEQNYREQANRRERNSGPYYQGYCENGRYRVEPPVPYPGRRGEEPEGEKYSNHGRE